MRYLPLILILLAGSISAEDSNSGKSYICIPDKSTGFVFNEKTKSWDQTNFRVEDTKYIVRPATKDDSGNLSSGDKPLLYKYGVWELGDDSSTTYCMEGISEAGWLGCSFGMDFNFNIHSMRFMLMFTGSYVVSNIKFKWDENDHVTSRRVADEGGDTPFIQIGKCSKL